jgi:hypothetical protein
VEHFVAAQGDAGLVGVDEDRVVRWLLAGFNTDQVVAGKAEFGVVLGDG